MLRVAIVLSLFSLLAGCAYSPQMITVSPQIVVDSSMPGQGQVIRASVIDRRPDPVLGSLGGIYGDTSNITLATDTEQALFASISDALVRMGFVVDPSYQGDLRLVVYLDKLVYSSPDNLYSNKIDMHIVLGVEASKAAGSYKNSYSSKAEKRFASHPDLKENQQEINKLLADTLERVFKDQALISFISR